jgi:hypothetical protein
MDSKFLRSMRRRMNRYSYAFGVRRPTPFWSGFPSDVIKDPANVPIKRHRSCFVAVPFNELVPLLFVHCLLPNVLRIYVARSHRINSD